ncbi:hypothetical protein Vadar_007906 [Vaccinium darrowii]|uniref:Uncharacterized protein n=1 Tax=Vaccinium darrowii TaxID=229202 RepID=A0ACB7Z9P2_9ERIC|nr:hypothetical protein Vadar_007906 [Vaccinium darrowii]
MCSNENQRKYRRIRLSRKGDKWGSEIRVQRSRKCIWLGTFETPKMAATAHDIASRKLRGQEAFLNFPANLEYYQMPASSLPEDICAATVSAMAANMRVNSSGSGMEVVCGPHVGNESSGSGGGGGGVGGVESCGSVGGVESCGSGGSVGGVESSGGPGCSGSASGGGDPWPWQEVIDEFIGEEEMFCTPKMMVFMANAMQVGPPKIYVPFLDDEGNSDGTGSWSYHESL